MTEYVDREALLAKVRPDDKYEAVLISDVKRMVKNLVNSVPIADVAPVVHGQWEWFEEWLPGTTEHPKECEDCGWRCGNCMRALEDMVGGYWDDLYDRPQLAYCPNCGARMDLEVIDR